MKRFLILLLCFINLANAQDPDRFMDEVRQIQNKYDSVWDSSRETVVFTGSSSVRIWHDLQDVFPEHQIVNTGFGGSQASDLIAYLDELVLWYNPVKVFIYEGDNDISFKKRPRKILKDIQLITDRITASNPQSSIVLIGAKPSIARWHLRRKYRRLNRKLSNLAELDGSIGYADVWDIMLDGRKVRDDIFIEDGLHMNALGYELWYAVLKNYMK